MIADVNERSGFIFFLSYTTEAPPALFTKRIKQASVWNNHVLGLNNLVAGRIAFWVNHAGRIIYDAIFASILTNPPFGERWNLKIVAWRLMLVLASSVLFKL